MTQEEKAKAYDIALDKIKRLLGTGSNCSREELEYVFPELKESEDERIRKEIISAIKEDWPGHTDWIAWLEKQGETSPVLSNSLNIGKVEQKSTDKVEPKFKVGDWVIDKQGIVHQIAKVIENVTYHTYVVYDIAGVVYFNDNTEGVRPWTIQDAKDGDVLYHKAENGIEYIVMSKGINEHGNIDSYFRYNSLNGFGVDIPSVLSAKYDSITPATKQQRDLLFKKMKEASYEWNAEKKELKIEQKYTPKHKVGDTIYYNSFGEVKSMIVANVVTDSTDNPMYEDENGNAVFEKALVEQKPTWGEEDEKYWSIIIAEFSKCAGKSVSKDEWMRCNDWLNSLRDRVLVQLQPKQEWSEEDKRCLTNAIRACEHMSDGVYDYSQSYIDAINWLKSLKPQSHWKPSEKQMKALKEACDEHWEPDGLDPLYTLYQNLKKLREE